MKMVIKILAFFSVSIIVFMIANKVYVNYYWEDDLKKLDAYGMYKDITENRAATHVLYLGESSNYSTASYDTVHLTIAEIVQSLLPEKNISGINRGAIHAGVFKQLIAMIPDDSPIDTVIVGMNLRSFSSDWKHSLYENNCQELCVFYNYYPPLFNKLRILFRAYDYEDNWKRREKFLDEITNIKLEGALTHKTTREWDIDMANNCCRDSNGVPDMPRLELSCHFVKAYGFNIHVEKDKRIKQFDEIVELCKKKKIKLYFNLLAENVEMADSLAGKELVSLIHANRDILIKRYTTEYCTVIDNMDAVGSVHFTDKTIPSEHYDYGGRLNIARNIAKQIQ